MVRKDDIRVIFILAALAVAAQIVFNAIGQFSVPDNWAVLITFYIIGAVSAYKLGKSNTTDGISLAMVFWFFNFIFFFLTPYLKYLNDGFEYEISDHSKVIANLLIILYLGLFHISYAHGNKLNEVAGAAQRGTRKSRALVIVPEKMFVAILLSFAIAAAFLENRGITWESLIGGWGEFGPLDSIAQFYFRPITFFTFLFAVMYFKTRPIRTVYHYIFLLLSLVPAILLNFPLSSNRFYVFAIYLGLLIILYPPNRNNRNLYLLILFSGIVGSFLLIILLKDTPGDSGLAISYLIGTTFDSYESFVYCIDYVSADGITWGRQLLGGLLFWVPRDIWPEKPTGTGSFVISTLHSATFTNVSSPLIEEGYINFSLVGIIAVSLLLGRGAGYLDAKYRVAMQALKSGTFMENGDMYLVFYPVLVGFFLFALRGDFLSSFAYVTGIFLSFLTVGAIVLRSRKVAR